MSKYIGFIVFAIFLYVAIAEVYPVFKNTSSCVTSFSNNFVRVGLLDNPPRGDTGRAFCKKQKKQIINLETCLSDSKEKESISGLTDFFFKLHLLFGTNINSLDYEKSRYNEVCGGYTRLKFKESPQ